jgi:iron-sulfur cluster assembly protein
MINLTPEAANYILKAFKEKGLPEQSAVRFIVKGGGCSGFTLEVLLEPPKKFEMPRRSDTTYTSSGVRILVDKKSDLFVDGMTVKLKQHQFGHKLEFDNPNATGICGCGESFAI